MKRFGHILSFLTVALFILAAASPANANPTDPSIIIQNTPVVGNPGTNFISGNNFLFTTAFGNDCQFLSPANTNPNDCAVQNIGSATWTGISFDIDGVQTGTSFTCNATAFFSNPCSIVQDADGFVATFSGAPGVPPFNAPDLIININGWTAGTIFDATISTPEPGTLALLLAGGGFFLARRRRQNVSHA
jgi:hypothetical protein